MNLDTDLHDKKSTLKRTRDEEHNEINSFKKSRSVGTLQQLLSPLTSNDNSFSCDSNSNEDSVSGENQPKILSHHRIVDKKEEFYSSPIEETQAFSQISNDNSFQSKKDDNEIWGYLHPTDKIDDKILVLKKSSQSSRLNMPSDEYDQETDIIEAKSKTSGAFSGRYLIGRHAECDLVIPDPMVSNRHAIIFIKNIAGNTVAVIEDLSSNGTFVNEGIIGRSKRRELKDFDEISISEKTRFVFRYPKNRYSSKFQQRYTLLELLGKGHFAEVFKCVEKSTGHQYAVKTFNILSSRDKDSDHEVFRQEIGVLISVNHPNLLNLKDVFEEPDNIYLVMELAQEGELFNWIIEKGQLTEDETRNIFLQIFRGVQYLHDQGIIHRDIKPENILLTDKTPNIKIADFGLSKIIGEESFTTSLCGTPSYVAPEIIEESCNRRYNRAVDIWSLGVVLYVCLCGFPPFSDELTDENFPYTLTQQIKSGLFNYPSPYWDSIGDPALDLIDSMLTVDIKSRITINECLEHSWLKQRKLSKSKDSASTIADDFAQLDFSKRRMTRERTLLRETNLSKNSGTLNLESTKKQ